SVAIYEHTLRRLAEEGQVSYLSGDAVRAAARIGALPPAFRPLAESGDQVRSDAVYVVASPEFAADLAGSFAGLLGPDRVRALGEVLEIRGLPDHLEEMGLGLRPQDVDRYRALGLQPVLRLRNLSGLTAEGLAFKGGMLQRLGRDIPVVFELIEVLGYERLIPQSAAVLRQAGSRFGRIEVFSVRRKQRGEDRLAQEMRPQVIRLFSLTPEELQLLPPEQARDKFVRSARERNIRLLYVRPFQPTAGVVGTQENLLFLEELARDLRRFGLLAPTTASLAPRAAPLPEIAVSPALRGLVAFGGLAAMGLTLAALGEAVGAPVPARLIWSLIGLGIVLTAATFVAGPQILWLKLVALGTAATLPAAAIAAAVPRRTPRGAVLAGVRLLWAASAGSIAAGLLVAALLTRWEFMMAAEVFLGVKAAHVLPVALVVLLLWRYDRPARSWRETAGELWDWSGAPLRMRYAIAAVIVGLAGVVLLARSGNFGFPLLSAEERLRSLLEDVLVARPRTKEYLIGHPALFLAGVAAAAGWRRAVMPLAALGAVGQAGIVNSFSHLHTPLLYTAWRTANALWLGTLLGALGALLLLRIVGRLTPPPVRVPPPSVRVRR
ncbi:MAG: DUF5693 family protein, partial [Armatimonadota bacterium]|nr:DUF5693 family protein [Armatimonadota bacterium]